MSKHAYQEPPGETSRHHMATGKIRTAVFVAGEALLPATLRMLHRLLLLFRFDALLCG